MTDRPRSRLRAALLSRAEETVVVHGLEALSLRELARELGVSHAAPARHFRTRGDLLDALAVVGFERLAASLRGALGERGRLDVRERLGVLGQAYLVFARDQGALLELMYSRKHVGDIDPSVDAAGRGSLLPLLELLDDAVGVGDLPAGDAAVRARILLSAVHGVSALAGRAGLDGMSAEALLSESLEALWCGMGGRARSR